MHLNVVGCYITQDEKFLMLKRRVDKSQGGLWGLPAGKIEPNESPTQAVVREVFEETSIKVDPSHVKLMTTINYDFGEKTVDFHLFSYEAKQRAEVQVNPAEHQEFSWFTFEEAYSSKELMHGVTEILDALKYTA